MKIFNSVFVICASLLIFAQCAKTEDENLDEREQAVFDLWMEKNGPADAQRYDNGMYIRWIRKAESGTKLQTDNFMYLDYSGFDLNGNLFSNRDSAVAVFENTFSLYTRYTPHYALFNSEALYFTQGEYEALAMMSEGDSIELFLPSMLGYNTAGTTFMSDLTYGYQGWFNSTSNPRNTVGTSTSLPSFNYKPVIIRLGLREVIQDAARRELSDASATAAALGLSQLDTLSGFYFNYITDPVTGESGEDLDSDFIGEDSTFYFNYTLRFLDDFLIATNVDTVAYNTWGDNWTKYAPASFTASTGQFMINESTSYYISALNRLIVSEKVRYNSRMQIVFISDWAYGSYGNSASSTRPIIYPYTPLKLDITTLEYGYAPTTSE